MMQTITFECEVITPMFLAGADGVTPELRAPSIKGALRFWWRAMNGHLSLDDMRKAEGEIFGSTSQRSSVILFPLVISQKEEIRISGTPHHRNSYCKTSNRNCFYGKDGRSPTCMKSKTSVAMTYIFTMRVDFNSSKISQVEVEQLFKITFLLGGIGKRERRGFGSIQISKINDKLCMSLKQEIDNFIDTLQAVTSNIKYPYFKKVELGKSYDNVNSVLIAIGESTHNFRDNSLGHTQQRFASPIYVSVIRVIDNGSQKYYPIITTLNTADIRTYFTPTTAQTNFITSLK